MQEGKREKEMKDLESEEKKEKEGQEIKSELFL